VHRCDARPDNLDDTNAHLRTHEKTDLLLELFDEGIIWDEYGLRSDVVVSLLSFLCDEITYFFSAIYTWVSTC